MLATGAIKQYVDPMTGLLPDLPSSPRVYHYAVFGCDAGGTCEATGSRASLVPSLVECLRGGGYTLFWRHSDATICSDHLELGTAGNTTVPNWWRSCDANCPTATARQLDANGVQHAITIGQRIRSMGIAMGRVISSEYCRCTQTAEWMAFGPTIETDPGITYWVYDEANRCTHCYERIHEVPAAGTNTAIIGHAGFVCSILDALAWGECAIFKPDGAGDAAFVTRLQWSAWDALAVDAPLPEIAGGGAWLEPPRESADGIRIRYRLATDIASPVRIEVFDVAGRQLWSVRGAPDRRGTHEITWNRRDAHGHLAPRGIYLIRLHAGTNAPTRKAVVLHP